MSLLLVPEDSHWPRYRHARNEGQKSSGRRQAVDARDLRFQMDITRRHQGRRQPRQKTQSAAVSPVNGRGMSLLLVPEDSQNPLCFLPPLVNVAAWEGVTNNPWVIATMTQGYRLEFITRPPLSRVLTVSSTSSHSEEQALLKEIKTLLEKEAIQELRLDEAQTGFCSRYFLVPKKIGTFRPILDLRGLNKFLKPLRFTTLTIPRVKQAVLQGEWFACIDLKNT
ncbi:hypothetical protein M9458_051055 [Cirrhinus mrigala]|uniref:Uncharacterized protein n=2 Tax=Cirrhinus mrigala TaxID=683832 RepID=A0ABD0MVR0_CIRMR